LNRDFYKIDKIYKINKSEQNYNTNLEVAPGTYQGKKMKRMFLIFNLSWLSLFAYAQDYIVLTNGDQIMAIVIEVSSTEVRYKLFERPNGRTRIVPRMNVRSIMTWDDTKNKTSKWELTSEASEKQTATSDMEEFKRCPYCGEEILAVAIKCKHCSEWLEKATANKTSKKQPTAKKSQGAILGNPFKGVAFGVNLLTGFTFKNSYSDVGFGSKLSYTFSVPIRLAGEFNILWGIPTNETWFLRTRWMDYGVCLQYLFLPGNKRVAIYPLVGIGGVNEKEKIEIKLPSIEDKEIESSINRFAFTLGYGFEGLSKNGKFCYGFGMRIKIANKAMGNNWGYRIHTVFGIGYKF